MKLGPYQQVWVDALRSGKYKQGTTYLNYKGAFCCLGVACEVLNIPEEQSENHEKGVAQYDGQTSSAPDYVVDVMKLRDNFGNFGGEYGINIAGSYSLADLNDAGKLTFADIADLIEQNAELFFTESN